MRVPVLSLIFSLHLSSSLTGWLGPHPVLESQPVGDDPHISLSHGAHLLHVVGNPYPLGRAQHPCGPFPTLGLLHWPRSTNVCPQPHLDAQEDHAAA